MKLPKKIDLHMHTTISDGTDTPEEILLEVIHEGINLFSVTDHDAIGACGIIKQNLGDRTDPRFITGIEFSCKDEGGKYHILGYRYDEKAPSMQEAALRAHEVRMKKLEERLAFLKEQFGFTFAGEDLDQLYQNSNPGKPHIANLMIRYGYAGTIQDAMKNYLNKKKVGEAYTLPEDAITAILRSGGIPVLAHPSFGDGDQRITGADMDLRLRHLMEFGLQGVEAYYSGFSAELITEMLAFAEKYDLYVTAGSDYHGTNKSVRLSETHLETADAGADGLKRFLEAVM